MNNLTEQIASTHLGKKSIGSDYYNPDLLVAIPRFENRKQYNIENNNLPFEGFDIWHAYEFSTMTNNGLPITRLMKLKYSCNSEFLVESKSLKLYLNSFNMMKYGKNIQECLELCRTIIEKDLSKALQTNVEINFLKNSTEKQEIFSNYKDLVNIINEENVFVEKFKEAPELLEYEVLDKEKQYFLTFDSLRSNCRVTHQPDFGDAYIYYKSKKHINEASLIKYLSSFRSEYHFHEECCEMIYKRLYDLLDKEDELLISILYTRRGGIDICPSRWNKNTNPKDVLNLLDINCYARKSIKQ